MYVCICKAVTDRQIIKAIRNGSKTCKEIGKETGAGTDCNSCCKVIIELIGKYANESK
jgi:bacterioferritin-associated ferredoxin